MNQGKLEKALKRATIHSNFQLFMISKKGMHSQLEVSIQARQLGISFKAQMNQNKNSKSNLLVRCNTIM